MKIPLITWNLGWGEAGDIDQIRAGEMAHVQQVSIPHNVQQAVFQDKASLFSGTQLEQILWTEEKVWTYQTDLVLEKGAGKHYLLVFDGLDYCCEIYLNGRCAKKHTGMFGTVTLDVTQLLVSGKNDLRVIFYLTGPMRQRDSRHYGLKCQNSYEWDAAPRMLTMGIWDQAYLTEKDASWIADWHMTSELSGQDARITLQLARGGTPQPGELTVRFGQQLHCYPLGAEAASSVSFPVQQPKLWYPHDLGEPYVYDVEICLKDAGGTIIDRAETKFGIRSLQMTRVCGADESHAPLQIVLNQIPVFIKGVNMVPLDVFPASIDEKRYYDFLCMVRDSGANLIRVWGGGLTEKDCFYSMCDALGLMVWQDFPLACQNPPETDEFLALLEDQARRIVLRLRNHCSVVLYCGGNELYVDWSRLKNGGPKADMLAKELEHLIEPFHWDTYMAGADAYQEQALQLLGSVCHELDALTPYRISSPLEREGEVHGPWGYDLKKGDQRYQTFDGTFYQFWNTYRADLYSEAGCSAMANEAQYQSIIPAAEQWPISEKSPALRYHKAFGAAWNRPDQWLDTEMVERFFGPVSTLQDMIWASQFLQAEGVRYLLEECRRKRPACCGVMVWAINETWPNAASLSVLDYDLTPKAAYHAMKTAFSPMSASLRYEDLLYTDGVLRCELWAELEKTQTATLQWSFCQLGGSVISQGCQNIVSADGLPQRYQTLSIPAAHASVIVANITLQSGERQFKNQYYFGNRHEAHPLAALLKNRAEKDG